MGMELKSGLPLAVGFEWGGLTEKLRQAMKKQQAEWEGGAEEGMASFYGGGRRGGARTRMPSARRTPQH